VSVHPVREAILKGALCARLRTKGMYTGGYDGPPPETSFDTAIYWCEASGWSLGPDDLPAGPERCRRPRGCFSPEAGTEP
jgi:hypothetical protein